MDMSKPRRYRPGHIRQASRWHAGSMGATRIGRLSWPPKTPAPGDSGPRPRPIGGVGSVAKELQFGSAQVGSIWRAASAKELGAKPEGRWIRGRWPSAVVSTLIFRRPVNH